MLTYGVVLHHVNVSPHTDFRTRALLEHFILFGYPKKWLRSQPFNNNELIEGVKKWLSSQAADFFDTGIQKLVPQYKYFNSEGDYDEK
jgi:hypothetical protein